MHKVYLSLGSNIYPRLFYLYYALNYIEKEIGRIDKMSSIHQTEPWKMPENTMFFYNMCVLVTTSKNIENVLIITQEIEKKLGRTKKSHQQQYESRCIDIDILLYDDIKWDNEYLVVPHPQMHLRKFVLLPLAEIAENIVHPVFKKKIKDLIL